MKEFFKLFKFLASNGLRMVGSLLETSSPREKEKDGENIQDLHGHLEL